MQKWEVEDSKYLYKTDFGNLRSDKCLLPNGVVIDDYHVCEFVDWVNCVAVTKSKEIVFVRQYRHGAAGFFMEIPAGAPHLGEGHIEAAARELKEETGYTSQSAPVKLCSLYTNPATNNNQIHTFLIRDVSQTDGKALDLTEQTEVFTFSLPLVKAMIKNGELNQLFSVCAIELALKCIEAPEV